MRIWFPSSRWPERSLRSPGSVGSPRRGMAVCAIVVSASAVLWASAPVAHAEPPVGEDYVLHCSGCHGADGHGVADTIPSLVGLDRYLAVQVGREYLVRAPGVAQAPLSDARLARLLNWMTGRFGNSEAVPPFSPEEVGRLRADPLRDPLGERAAVLERLAAEKNE